MQALRAWYKRLTEYLVKEEHGKLMITQIYVGDIVFEEMSNHMVQHFVRHTQSEFEMSLVDELIYFIGLQVK